ncbi:hypothetical protein GJ629_03510 [Halapricum sp. CBA1109]|uniref:hypothetical protein n=1 Tax=Halapricum sp. CBA1109 TaxID=2668068 RepID=UPI0012F9433F|nr:hypothetical protein [Halapricum sp. CBA1109]MUV89083.1 hypothetical protein [Halapricum sp. CBA1109]
MSSAGSKLSVKERIGYEVFLFTGLYGLYNLFFSNQLLIDAVIFSCLFGSLFIRYHIVVSDGMTSKSRSAKTTGTLMFCGGVAIISYLVFQAFSMLTASIAGEMDHFATLVGSIAVGIIAVGLVNLPVFRFDSQRREIFKEKLSEGGLQEIIARIGLFFDREIERSSYDSGSNSSPLEDLRKANRLIRQGEVGSENRAELRQAIQTSQDVTHIFTVAFHALISVALLLLSILIAEIFTNIEGIEILSVVIMVASIYYSFQLLNLRFGLRWEVERSFWIMPVELLFCVLLTDQALYYGGFTSGNSVILLIPFLAYLLSNKGGLISQKMIMGLMNLIVDIPETNNESIQEILKKND